MADIDTQAAQPAATQPPVAPNKYDAFFGSQPPEAPAAPPTDPAAPPAEPEPAPAEKPQPLAEIIRQQREARQARQAAEAQAATVQKELEEARAQLARYSKADIVADPLAWAEAHGLSPEELAVLGETFLYSLVPEKAPAEWRVRLLETQTKRKERQAQSEAEKRAAEAEQAKALEVQNQYIGSLEAALQSTPAGTYPESEAWFGEDREDYMRSLFATAVNMAEAARAVGKQADITFAAVAKVLEEDFKVRHARRGQTGGTPAQTQQTGPSTQTGTKPAPDKQAGDATSTTKLGGNGTPRPPATTEAERIQRATEVAFRSR